LLAPLACAGKPEYGASLEMLDVAGALLLLLFDSKRLFSLPSHLLFCV
jgi:hypothetical protein